MSYEEEAKELMKKFKLQFSQQSQTQNVDLSKMYNKDDQDPIQEQDDISKMIQSFNLSGDQSSNLPTDQSPSNQDIPNVIDNSQNHQSTDQSPPDQDVSIVTDIQNESQTSPLNTPVPMGAHVCPQCNTIHPPLRPGEECPNTLKDVSGFGLDDSSVNKFLVDIRNMVISQLNKKGIEDGSKFFQFAIVELMKILETYNEK